MNKLHVNWIKDAGCLDGGYYAICAGNGHLVLIAARKGRHTGTMRRLTKLCALWNTYIEGGRMTLPRDPYREPWDQRVTPCT